MQNNLNITALFVTHDLKEALLMGDKISYMENGKLDIYDSKHDFINDPSTGVQNEIGFWNDLSKLAYKSAYSY